MSHQIFTHRPVLGTEELSAVARVMESGWLGMGPLARAFEDALGRELDVPHVVAVSSGTAALHLALEALDLPRGSGVLVPSLTFVATVQAILAAGLVPVFCEVDPTTLQIDLADVTARLDARVDLPGQGARIRAVLPVHFGGSACDMPALVRLAEARGLAIVEDAAHAFGSSAGGRALGTLGTMGCFSFDPIKNITCGEGGAVVTSSARLADRVRQARVLGIAADGWSRHTGAAKWHYDVRGRGWRCHLPDLNAAIGLAQLAKLDEFRARRQALVRQYAARLAGAPRMTPVTVPDADVCPFTYTIRVHGGRRDALMASLRAVGIGTTVEYIPNHLHEAFAAFRRPLPVTERVFGEILSLPLHAGLRDEDVAAVASAVRAFLEDEAAA